MGKKREILRSSFRKRGSTRIHRLGLSTLAGHLRMRPDSLTGKTLVLPEDRRIAAGPLISYWAIESGVADPVKAGLESARVPRWDVVGHVISDWTDPQVMILIVVMPEASVAS